VDNMTQPVLTRSYDNARSGTNYQETVLTASAVRQRGIVRLFSIPLPGDARGAEAQPLIIPNVPTTDGFHHDILLVATMGNMLCAFDATSGKMLWAQRVGNPIVGSKTIDWSFINQYWGILSTPVVDPVTNIVYCVAYSSVDGTYQNGTYSVRAHRLYDGAMVHQPLSLEAATHTVAGLPLRLFSSAQRKQRAGLLLTTVNGVTTLFIPSGSIFESLASNVGWLIAVDVKSFTISAAITSCPKDGGGGIWMSGQGVSADTEGNLYLVTGNGTFNGVTDFGECICRISYTPGSPGSLKIVDWFTPFADSLRDGGGSDTDAPVNRKTTNDWYDQDLGSAGVLVVEALGLTVVSGKDGIAYVNRMKNLGKTTEQQVISGANFAALASPPIWFTYYPGPNVSPMPTKETDLNFQFSGRTFEMHSTPVHYRAAGVDYVYCWGANGNLRAWRLSALGTLSYQACSAEVASANEPPPGGMPGGMITVSANTADPTSGVVWACLPYLDAGGVISPGRLLAYDATKFGKYSDGSGAMEKIWDSEQWDIQFTHNKYNVPIVSNGRLYVPTYSGTIDVYGLTPQ
jgi:hypothetical protein